MTESAASLAATLAPDDPLLADAAHDWKSAYVHIPFCRRRCPYCDFAIVDESAGGSIPHDRYVDAVLAEIAMEDGIGALDAVDFGGGTPSLVAPGLLASILQALSDRFGLRQGAEVSLELNPEDWTDEVGAGLVSAGFTRVSIGGQSLDPHVLGALGRLHEAGRVADAVLGAREAGFASVAVDLILGHPAESDASWRTSVEGVLALDVDHVSTYALTVEPGTALAGAIRDGAPPPDEDAQADRYALFGSLAPRSGIVRYEVSNHARAGHVCRYNLATWAHGEYLGFGMAAHDHRWGRRARNHRRLDRYLEAVEAGERPRLGVEELSPTDQERDRLMLGLRLAAGTPMTPTARRFAATPAWGRFEEAGVVSVSGDRLVVRDPMLADAVAREALSVTVDDC